MLKIKFFGKDYEDICELEDAKFLLNFDSGIISVDGQRIKSYDELVSLASQEKYRKQEYIEVIQLSTIVGG